ncbi:MAG: DUF427 domain-containing protein [Pseudomonadota bacterium]
MKAIWNGVVLAESDDTVVVERNHYFPEASLNRAYFTDSTTTSTCFWKGTANYYNVVVAEKENADAAFYYAKPKKAASNIKDRVAFWRGVEVVE